MVKTKLRCLFLLLSFSFVFNSCRQDEDFTKYASFPINLQYEDASTGLKLKWNKINTSDFVQYIVVKSTLDSIPDIKTGTAVNTIASLARITDVNKTEFIDASTATTKAYYRVFAQLGNRFVSSGTVSPSSNLTSVTGNFYEFLYNPKLKALYMFDRNNGLISYWDVNKNAIIRSVKVSFSSSNPFFLAFGQSGGFDELYFQGIDASFNAVIYAFDPATLSVKDQIATGFTSSTLYSFCADYSGVLYAHSPNSSVVRAISRAQKTILSTNILTNSGYSLRFKKLTDSKIVGMPSTNGYAQLLQYNIAGQYVSPPVSPFIQLVSTGTNNPFVVSPFENVFIYGFNGVVYDKDMKILGTLGTATASTYRDFVFSEDAKYIYAATLSNTGRRQIDVFAYPSLTLEKSINTKTFCRNIFFTGNNQIVLLSDGFDNLTGIQTTVFEKIDVTK